MELILKLWLRLVSVEGMCNARYFYSLTKHPTDFFPVESVQVPT